jgi:hypothetical protein
MNFRLCHFCKDPMTHTHTLSLSLSLSLSLAAQYSALHDIMNHPSSTYVLFVMVTLVTEIMPVMVLVVKN